MNVDFSRNARQALRAHGLHAQLVRTLKKEGTYIDAKAFPSWHTYERPMRHLNSHQVKGSFGAITDSPLHYKNAGTAVIV